MDTEARVVLERISGDVKLIRQSQETLTRDMDRSTQSNTDFQRRIDERLHSQSNRIGVLEAARTLETGIRKGTETTIKRAWLVWTALGSGTFVAAVAALLRGLHV